MNEKNGHIFGIGTDIVDVKRLRSIVQRNERFVSRVFSENEISYCRKKKNQEVMYTCFAERFAAKEAVLKAFGIGIFGKIKLSEIEVINNDKGKPLIRLSGASGKFARDNNIVRVEISLSGIKEYAVAYAVAFQG